MGAHCSCSDICVSGDVKSAEAEIADLKIQCQKLESRFEESRIAYAKDRAHHIVKRFGSGDDVTKGTHVEKTDEGVHVETSDGQTMYKGFMKNGQKDGWGLFRYNAQVGGDWLVRWRDDVQGIGGEGRGWGETVRRTGGDCSNAQVGGDLVKDWFVGRSWSHSSGRVDFAIRSRWRSDVQVQRVCSLDVVSRANFVCDVV